MAASSKLLQYSTYSCYEVGHTWTPSCLKAVSEIGLHGVKTSLKIYAPLYLITALLRRKNANYFKTKLIREILQSSLFLGANAFFFIGSFCVWRHLLGIISFPSGGFVPALCSTFISILLERKDRRGILAMYVANLAVETLYRMAEFRGIVRPIKNGEVLLFSVVTALYMYLYRSRNGLRGSLRAGIQLIVGPSEVGDLDPVPSRNRTSNHRQSGSHQAVLPVSRPKGTMMDSIVNRLPEILRRQIEILRNGIRHPLCRHPHSCGSTALESGLRLLVVGYGMQAVIKVLGTLGQLTRKPRAVFDALLHSDNAAFAKFLASFGLIFQAVNCVLRWCRGKDDSSLHGLLSGFLAGWSMMFYKSSTIAMYTASKLAEVLWFKGVEKGVLPLVKCADIIIYTISTSIVFHAAVFEPHAIKPAYWKFLTRLTNGRFKEMNRKLLDVYGTQASRAFPDFWPKYDPRYTNLPATMPKVL